MLSMLAAIATRRSRFDAGGIVPPPRSVVIIWVRYASKHVTTARPGR